MYDYDALVIRVDVFSLPDYHTLEHRCPGIASYTAFLRDITFADKAERILLASQEIVIDSRGLAKFVETKRAQWVKKVLVIVGLWNGDKSSTGSAARRLEGQALTDPMMTLSEMCTQLETVRVEVCLWSSGRADEKAESDRYVSEWMSSLSVEFPEAESKYKALARPLLHLERTGLLNDLLIRHYDRHRERFRFTPPSRSAVFQDRRLCRSFDIMTNTPYDPTYEYWSSNDHENCRNPDGHLRVRYGPGAKADPPIRDTWVCRIYGIQEYGNWVPIYIYDRFTARHWIQFALREEADLQTAQDHFDPCLGRARYMLNYTHDRWVLHEAIREILAMETQPFDYPHRQRGKHGNFVMGPCEPPKLSEHRMPY